MGEEIGRHTQYYYNVRTGQVVQEGESKSTDLLGPYPDAASAAAALASVHEREARKEAEDRAWSDGES